MGSAGHKAGSVGASWVCHRCEGGWGGLAHAGLRGAPWGAGRHLRPWPAAHHGPRLRAKRVLLRPPSTRTGGPGCRPAGGTPLLWELFSPLRVQAQSAALCHCGHFRFRDLRSPAELRAPSGAEVTLCRLLPARGAQARSHVLPLAASPESPRRLRAEGGRRPGDRETLSEGIAEAEAASGAASLQDLGAGHPHGRIPCPPLGKSG